MQRAQAAGGSHFVLSGAQATGTEHMILTAVTNEVFPDATPGSIAKIFERAAGEGITNFELRLVEGKRFPMLDADAWGRLKAASNSFGIRYSAVSPGLFKASLNSELTALHANQLLSMSLDLAEIIDVSTLIVFAPMRDALDQDSDFDRVVDMLGRAVDQAAARGFTTQLENLPGSWADTSDNCLALLKSVNRPEFGYVWDTGNLYEAEQTHFRAGYEKLKPYIRNVHLKDCRIVNGEVVWTRYGDGAADVKGQVAALRADGYAGTLVLEAACKPHHLDDFPSSIRYLKSVM
jgi:sugar phosphate isomerase/epimerase